MDFLEVFCVPEELWFTDEVLVSRADCPQNAVANLVGDLTHEEEVLADQAFVILLVALIRMLFMSKAHDGEWPRLLPLLLGHKVSDRPSLIEIDVHLVW
jgi:hypothetical protein